MDLSSNTKRSIVSMFICEYEYTGCTQTGNLHVVSVLSNELNKSSSLYS